MLKIEALTEQGLVPANEMTFEITNKSYFKDLGYVLEIQDMDLRGQEIIKLNEKHFGFESSENKQVKEIEKDELLIYKSLQNSLRRDDNNSVLIVDYYINEIQCLMIRADIKENCIKRLQLLKDFMIFSKYDNDEKMVLSGKIKTFGADMTKKKWNCLYRDCMDCCIYYHLKEVEDGNIIDYAWFIIKLPASLAKIFTSCGFDCIFESK